LFDRGKHIFLTNGKMRGDAVAIIVKFFIFFLKRC